MSRKLVDASPATAAICQQSGTASDIVYPCHRPPFAAATPYDGSPPPH